MAFILRKLDHKASFYQQDWLQGGDAQADALSDLMTKGNQLSVWLIEDDRSNLDRVVAALAAGRDRLAKLDYAMIDRDVLASLGIRTSKVDGRSPDNGANQRWHQDLARLSGSQLVGLAVNMRDGLRREPKSKVRASVIDSIRSGFVARDSVKSTLLESLKPDLE